MKLFEINFTPYPDRIIKEGYGRLYNFDYHGNQVTDNRPKALSLGKWKSGRGNNLMAGINLNYLSPEQITRLQKNLPTVLRNRNLQRRARTLRAMMPDIFNTAYRTYYKDAVDNVDPGTLKFIGTKKDIDKDPKNVEATKPDTAPTATTDTDDVTAPRLRKDKEEVDTEKSTTAEPTELTPTKPITNDDDKTGTDEIGTDEIDIEDEEQEEI